MRNGGSWRAIDQYSRGSRGNEDGHPFPPSRVKTQVLKDLEQEWPRDRIKGPRDVHLEEDSRLLELVELSRSLLDEEEVVVDAST